MIKDVNDVFRAQKCKSFWVLLTHATKKATAITVA